ncbi:MAG: adenylate/guanylate cyclase domain-containing protein [Deltaproteobacteria bacterium]|nr:adenylate/guanylate cyclase domain-containing protein [Deltaproteobacteria bacterium]
MKLARILAWFRRHLPFLIAFVVALTFCFIHFVTELEIFEYGLMGKKGFLRLLDLKALDLKFMSRSYEDLPEPSVTVAAIDEKGIARYGLWPWSRTIVGEFIRKTTAQGAKVIGFDAIFADEDKNSSYQSIKRFVQHYEEAQLRPESAAMRELLAAVDKAEADARAADDAVKDLEKKLRGKAVPAKPLSAAKSATEVNAKTLAKAKSRLAELARASDKFYQTMAGEVANVSPDDALANAVAESPQTVLGFVGFNSLEEFKGMPDAQLAQSVKSLEPAAIKNIYDIEIQDVGGNAAVITRPAPINIADLGIHKMAGLLAPLPKVAARAKGFGFFNATPDPDGPIRKMWTLYRYGDRLYPSLALQTIARYYGGDIMPMNSEIAPGEWIGGVEIGGTEVVIPTDQRGRLLINYYTKPRPQKSAPKDVRAAFRPGPEGYFPTFSVADFIDGSVPPKYVKDKVVLFGMTALGWFDLRPNPFSAATPGVYIHANVVQNAIDGRFLDRPIGFAFYEILFYLILGIILGVVLPRIPVWAGLLVTLGFAFGLYFVDVLFFFSKDVWILNVLPTLQAALTFVGVTVHGYLTEGKEKRKIRKAFQFYLTRSVVDEVLKDPTKLKLGGERKTCTVLFSDIRGFTTISERLSPEELVSLLNSYLTPMTNLVFKHDGTLDKYMGDAVMAIFGAPINYPNHAVRACLTALDMMDELKVLQAMWREKSLPEIDIGIGLNTGPMAVGNMGSEAHFAYTVMGDNVNLGSRLESINKQYGTNIIISEFTHAAVKDEMFAREMDSVRVKGKREPVRIFELLGRGKPDPTQQELITTFESGMALYKAQKWDEAVAAFTKVRTTLKPNDFASSMYIDRCEHMKAEPPGEGWDGVYTMKTK